MKTLLVCTCMSLIPSCMHVGMMQTEHGDSQQRTHSTTTVEKEVIIGDLRAIATFPSLTIDNEAVVTLKLSRGDTPLSLARGYLRTQYTSDKTGSHDKNHLEIYDDDPSVKDENTHPFKETDTPGQYIVSCQMPRAGEIMLAIHITAIGDSILQPNVVIETTQSVSQKPPHPTHAKSTASTLTTYTIIGTVLMGAMMISMLLVRGSL